MLTIAFFIFTIPFMSLIIDTPGAAAYWLIRVLASLAVGAMSISLLGSIRMGNDAGLQTLAHKEPKITAVGTLVVVVLVYLFNPISSLVWN